MGGLIKFGSPLKAGGRPAKDPDCCECELSCQCLGTIIYEFDSGEEPDDPEAFIGSAVGVGHFECCVVFRARFFFEDYDGFSGNQGWVYFWECCCAPCDCEAGTYLSTSAEGGYPPGGAIYCGGIAVNYGMEIDRKNDLVCLGDPEDCYVLITNEMEFNQTPDCTKKQSQCTAVDNGEGLEWKLVYKHCDFVGDPCPETAPTTGGETVVTTQP